MAYRVLSWFGLISVITIALAGFGLYFALLAFIVSFIVGVVTVLHLSFDPKKIFSTDIDGLDPLQYNNFPVYPQKVLELFETEELPPKFDSRITGSETVDSFLNEIISIIINDYVTNWYEVLTKDQQFTSHAIRQLVVEISAKLANRIKCVDWIYLLSTKFPEELTSHLKLFKQSRVRLKHLQLLSAKEVANGTAKLSPNKGDDRRTHRRNKSETDLSWSPDAQLVGKSKFYGSSENIGSNNLRDMFFDLECAMENKQICRDTFCTESEKEYALLCEVSEAILYLVAPEDAWKCHALKLFSIELISAVVLRPHSRDSAGEWELPDRQKLSSLQYLTRIIQARRATLGPQEDAPQTSRAVIDNLRSSALEICDTYLAPNRSVMGVPESCHADMVRKITTEGEEFTNNPPACFDEVQKCVCDALEEDPTWQSDFMMDGENDSTVKSPSDLKKEAKSDGKKYGGDVVLPVPGSRHNRSRSDIVGNFAQKMLNENVGASNLSSANSTLVQDKGRTFGIYAIAVTRASDNEVWHIYRRYSDFYDLHSAVKEKWPELANLPFPAKKTFQNTSRTVLESRKRVLNSYLQSLTIKARDARYITLLSPEYLGGFLSPEIQTERHGNTGKSGGSFDSITRDSSAEVTLCNIFPDNNIPELFKKLYANSPRVNPQKKSVNV
ncbi:unnamed protein product [Leptidea sinapis]|uniref:PX domain-containing protein n=1 Tax=Leptidea sinapis TaxID=189913 RepID=A0A5E4R0L8_9NEOP|nr:unnamed protein product [Leptidea sinapis]